MRSLLKSNRFVVGALLGAALLITISFGASTFLPQARAQLQLLQLNTLPFGGFVFSVVFCTCSAGAIVNVGPPRGGSFLYVPGATQVFQFFQIPRPNVWLLGNYSPGVGACLVFVGKGCVPLPHQGLISIVGTSR